ncbi:aa3-type cytochrome c oxidase subunit IV [uncultured Roseobacter sp.]|nr:aa3-type cytochrome c oxidase subunit IV [uncultured Roseobacter sp.]
MAEHKHGEMDTETQEKTFAGFMAWTKWSVIVIIGIIIWMAIFIT